MRYLIFMGVYLAALIMQRNVQDAYVLESAVKQELMTVRSAKFNLTLSTVRSMEHFWDWTESGLLVRGRARAARVGLARHRLFSRAPCPAAGLPLP